jgi:uncharacterized SAM-dependent methyltransferase
MAWFPQLQQPVCILSLGSMFGNDAIDLAIQRLRPWAQSMRTQDHMLLGMDACQNEEDLWDSYHDEAGCWHEFIFHGLEYSNEVLGHKWFRRDDWKISGVVRRNPTMHTFTIQALANVECPELEFTIFSGEVVEFFEAWKYGPDMMRQQFKTAGFSEIGMWRCAHAPFCKPAKFSS